MIIRCVTGYSSLEMEIMGILGALRLANDMDCKTANFFSGSVEAIWNFQVGVGSDVLSKEMEAGLTIIRSNPGWRFHHIFQRR